MSTSVLNVAEFPKMFQMELLRHMIRDPDLFWLADGVVDVSDFDYPPCQTVFDALRSLMRTYREKPVIGTLFMAAQMFAEEGGVSTVPLSPADMPAFHSYLFELQTRLEAPLDLPYYKSQILPWVKRVRLNMLLRDNNSVSPQNMDRVLSEAAKINSMEMKGDSVNEFIDPFQHVPLVNVETQAKRISTGLNKLDRRIGGGLGINEFGVVMASPGVGKTTALLNFAAAAVRHRYRVLFITLEMVAARIAHRFISIASHIYSSQMRRPVELWTDADLARYAFAQANFPPQSISIYDHSRGKMTMSQLDFLIQRWRKRMYNDYGPDAAPSLVCVDWISQDYLALTSSNANTPTHEIMGTLGKQLGQVGRNNTVAMWSAAQANASGDGKEFLTMRNMSSAYAMSHPLDVGVGLAAIRDLNSVQSTITEDDDIEDPTLLAEFDKGRRLSMNSFKNRDNPEFKFELFQGSTLRMWDRQEAWDQVAGRLRRPNSHHLVAADLMLPGDWT